MGNRPEYFAIWLGLIQIGAICALIGPDLPVPALAHALKVADACHVITSVEHADVCRRAVAELGKQAEIWVHGGGRSNSSAIDLAFGDQSGKSLTGSELRR